MKTNYWDVTDEQVVARTGKPIAHWMATLRRVDAENKSSNEFVVHLQKDHGVPRYWARTLTTLYLKTVKV